MSIAVRAEAPQPAASPGRRSTGGAGFVPALDGLRGVAVLLVILYHFAPDVMPAGFLGVDVFFVLSGFLITRLLLVEAERSRHIALGSFWSRRARRLLPAMFLTVAGTCLIARLTDLDGGFTGLARHARAAVLYVVNWAFITERSSYFASFETPSPLRHLWSLAIEEQFYLVWPIVLLVVYRLVRRPLRTVGLVAVLGAVGSATLMAVLFRPGADPSRVYYGTDTRIFGVLIGAFAAVLLLSGSIRGRLARALPFLGALAIVGVLVAAWRLDDHSEGLYRGGLVLVSVAVAVLVVAVTVAPLGGAAPVLSNPLLRQVGVVSYGLYLFHWPVFIYVSERTTGRTGVTLFALRCIVTAAAAVCSYVLVERPIRERRLHLPGVSQAALAVAVAVTILALTSALPSTQLLPVRADAAPTTAPPSRGTRGTETTPPAAGAPAVPPSASIAPSAPLRILAAGDSVALLFGLYWPSDATPDVAVDAMAGLGCRLQDGKVLEGGHVIDPKNGCEDWRTSWPTKLASFAPDVVVLFATVWETYDSRVAGREIAFGSAESDVGVTRYLDELRAMTHAAGARLVLVASPPITGPDQPKGTPRHRGEEWRVDHLNQEYRAYSAAHADEVSVLAMDQLVCPSAPCSDEVDGTPVFSDGVHFTRDGLRAVAGGIVADLRAMTSPG